MASKSKPRKLTLLLVVAIGVVLLSACAAPPALPVPREATPQSPPPAPAPTQPPPPPKPEPPPPMPKGTPDADLQVIVYNPDKAWPGTTILADNHNLEKPRIIEVNMLGEILWQYPVPLHLRQFTNPGFDVEPLPNGNVLFVLPRNGAYEINRRGDVVWSYLTEKISHDADRLPNGNTLLAFGAMDQLNDAQAKEVNPQGQLVWAWYAKDYFYQSPYKEIQNEGWTHTNAVSRLANGNTLISHRNFNFVVEVDAKGAVVRTIGEGFFSSQHDPEMLPNGNMLVALQWRDRPHQAVEVNLTTNNIVWQFPMPEFNTWPVRDANRLPNGNTLITGSTVIVEVTPRGEIVWQLSLKGVVLEGREKSARGFYKAERIGVQK